MHFPTLLAKFTLSHHAGGLLRRGLLLGLLWPASCTGAIDQVAGPSSAGSVDQDDGTSSDDATSSDNRNVPPRFDGEPSALRRLNRDELVTSMQILTGEAPARASLPEEPREGHGPLLTAGMSFVGQEVTKLHQVIGDFANAAAPNVLRNTACTQTDQSQRDCLLGWAMIFATQALRRELRDPERKALQKILSGADGTPDADVPALASVLTATFVAPSFLYRTELGAAIVGEPGLRALTTLEVATKLSYLTTLASPDAELLAAAEAGRLQDAEGRAQQVSRLTSGPLGGRAQAVLVLEWLNANEPKLSQKSAKYLRGLGPDSEAAFRASAEATIIGVLASADATVENLLTTDEYLAAPALRQVMEDYGTGVTATGDGSALQRAGLLMHPHVIASHTKEDGASPFQLGSFLREALLCQGVGAPPVGAVDLAKKDEPDGLSIREGLEFRTAVAPVCTGCHAQFAPLGFAFLPFDPVGRWTRQDPSGKAWDLSGTIATYGEQSLTFSSPTELSQRLAAEPQVHSCFAQVAVQWSLGRKLVKQDAALVAAVDEVARRTRGNLPAILAQIVRDPSFVIAVAPRSTP